MKVVYHPLVQADVAEALSYYRRVSPLLAGAFEAELRAIIDAAAENPLRFHPVAYDFRRANLKRFPFHVLYEVGTDTLRVMLVRHNKRHPDYGLPRA